MNDSIVSNHLASLSVFDYKLIDDDFPDEQFVLVAGIVGWRCQSVGIWHCHLVDIT